MNVKLLWATPAAEYQIVRAARICYNSEDQSDTVWPAAISVEQGGSGMGLGPNDKALLQKLVSNRHGMVLRFASAAVNISGISRVASHQLVRIAHFGILQRSQRYVDESGCSLALGSEFEDTASGFKGEINELHGKAQDLYQRMLDSGSHQEVARYALLNATETNMNLVSNFQGWSHFFTIRLQKKVQRETYKVAKEIWRQLNGVAPTVFGKFEGAAYL